jgi:hypothetical protein
VTLESRILLTAELSGVTGTLAIDIFVNELQLDGRFGADLSCDCPNVLNGKYIGHVSVANARVGMWNRYELAVPKDVQAAFSSKTNACTLKFAHLGTGMFRYDNMGFVK